MEYIKLEDNLRISYEIRESYFTGENIKDLVDFDEILEDNLYTYDNYAVNGLIAIEELAEELGECISLLDTIKYDRYPKIMLEDIEESLFTEEEWLELAGDKTKEEIIKDLMKNDSDNELKELKEILSNTKINELYYYKEIIIELVEENKINSLLNNMKVIQGAWTGCGQGDYIEYFSLIKYDTEEERELLENKVEEKFKYLNMLFSGDMYDISIKLEKQKLFKELGGERIEIIWVTEEKEYYNDILIDYLDLENYIKEQAKELTNKKYHEQIENEKLDIDIVYY